MSTELGQLQTFMCQSTPRWVLLTSTDHADTSPCSVATSPMRRRCRHWRVMALSSFSAMFNQSAVFRRVAELEATNQLPGPGRLEHFVEGALGVRVQVVAHQDDLLALGVAALQQAGHLHCPVRLRAPGPRRRLPPARQRLGEQEDRGRARPFVIVVDTAGSMRRGGHRRARLLDQLHRLFMCGRLQKCKPFLKLLLAQSAPVVLRDNGAAPRRRDCCRSG